jgi:hypothetical protein
VISCGLAGGYLHFGGVCHLHVQGLKYVITPRYQAAVEDHNAKICNKSLENMASLKYIGTTVMKLAFRNNY